MTGVVLVATVGVFVARAQAASTPLAEVVAATPVSGGDGWLVWSAPVAGGYALLGYHDGAVLPLPVATRPQPFDASVGTDRAGAPVVVFSRCARSPAMRGTGGETPGGVLVEPLTGSGCRIHLLPLRGGAERALPIPAPAGVSDTTPAIWRGVVTFGRRAPVDGRVMQVLSWSARAPRRLVTLTHGAIPECPSVRAECRERPVEAEVQGLASDGSAVAFVWAVWGGAVGIDGERELRIDHVHGRGATIADGDIGGEACTGASAGEHRVERVAFEPPFVSASTVSFGELYTFGCFTGFAGVLVTHGVAPGYASRGKLDGVVPLDIAQDNGRLYGLLAPRSEASDTELGWTATDGPYCDSQSPCAIESLPAPALKRDARPPFDPISFY